MVRVRKPRIFHPQKSITSVCFDGFIDQRPEFAGRNDNTVWTTGDKSEVGQVSSLGDTPQPDPSKPAKSRAYADIFLKHPRTNGGRQRLQVVSSARGVYTGRRHGVVSPLLPEYHPASSYNRNTLHLEYPVLLCSLFYFFAEALRGNGRNVMALVSLLKGKNFNLKFFQ